MKDMKEEPWNSHGLHLGVKLTPNAMGWALLRPEGTHLLDEGRADLGDDQHEAAALYRWQEAGCPERVVIYKYANQAAFDGSPDKEGMTRDEHNALADRVAAKLRRHGALVDFEMVEF